VIEATGTEDKIESLLEVLKPYGVSEMVRTGVVAMARGTGTAARAATRVAADVQDNLGSYSV
jgi:acetolactate synthase-1/3 small subunit